MSNTPLPRVAVVDVLRAFALFGIILSHSASGFHAGPPPRPGFMDLSPLDVIVSRGVDLLCDGKFFSIFSFLFGLSFAIQLGNAAHKGTSFAGRFAWRLVVLFGIGMAHQLLFNGDILAIYALLGLLLIPLGKLSNRLLLITGLVLMLNIPGLLLGLSRVSGAPPTAATLAAGTEARQQFMANGRRQYEINKTGSLADIAGINYSWGLKSKAVFQWRTGRAWITFGCFLLGVFAWRTNLFRDSESSRRFFTRLLTWSSGVAVAATVVVLAYPAVPLVNSMKNVWAIFAAGIQNAALSAVYVSLLTLLYWKRQLFSSLAPLGKMGLTTYLMQSVFGAALFFGVGFGMLGEIGSTAAVAAAAAFFVVQVAMARAWLAHFSMGPIEWLWRSLTYFKLHPSRVPVQPAMSA